MLLVTDTMIEEAKRHNKDLKLEMALALYSSEVFPLRKAAEYAGVSWLDVAEEAKKRDIPVWDSLTPEDMEEEFKTIQQFKKI
jgi:predicted HTH domain antitoxin